MPKSNFFAPHEWLVLLGLFVLVVVLRLPSLDQPLENDSASVAYHARLITRGEPLYGTHHTAHHMPGSYYLYALAFELFGTSVRAIKIMIMVWIGATVGQIYLLGLLLKNRRVGVMAAIFAAVLFAQLYLAGTSAKPELLVGLPRVTAVLVLLLLIQKKAPPRAYFWVGVLNSLTFIFKVNYLSPGLLAGLVLLVELWQNRREPRLWHVPFVRGLWILGGFILPLVPIVLYFAHLGLLERFLMIFRIGFGYVQLERTEFTSPVYILLYPLLIMAANNAVLLIAGLSGLLFMGLDAWQARQQVPPSDFQTVAGRYVALWFGLCFLETAVSRTYLLYYYLVFVPAWGLLAALFLERVYAGVAQAGRRKLATAVLSLALVAAFLASAATNYKYYGHYANYAVGQETYQQFLDNGLPEGTGQTIAQLQEIAAYITARTTPTDTIYYWSSLIDLYFLLDRRCSYDIIWPYYAGALGDRDKIFTATYFLVGDNSLGIEETPPWLTDGLAQNYTLETVLYGQQIYRHK